MRVGQWLSVTQIEDKINLRVDKRFYDAKRDNRKKIDTVFIPVNGMVEIHTREKKKRRKWSNDLHSLR